MGGDVHEGGDVRVDARLGDDGSTIAVTNQDARTILALQDTLGRGHVVTQASEWLLETDTV